MVKLVSARENRGTRSHGDRPCACRTRSKGGCDARPVGTLQGLFAGAHLDGSTLRTGTCPGRHGHDFRNGERRVGRRAARRLGHHHARRSSVHADHRDAPRRDLHFHAHTHGRVFGRCRVPGIQERRAARHHRRHPAAGGRRLHAPGGRRVGGGPRDRRLAAAADDLGQRRRDLQS